jgi:hypothetical protein
MEVSGQWSASLSGRFTPTERVPDTPWIGGWVGPRAVLDAVVKRKIPSPRRESNPRTPIVQSVTGLILRELYSKDVEITNNPIIIRKTKGTKTSAFLHTLSVPYKVGNFIPQQKVSSVSFVNDHFTCHLLFTVNIPHSTLYNLSN